MSYVKPERRPATWWRTRAQTIGNMIDQGWVIWSVCRSCFLTMQVELQILEIVMGEDETLWNREPPCRRLGCDGVTRFHGVPAETNECMPLTADWPPEWRESPPAPKPRVPVDQQRPPLGAPRTPTGSLARPR